MPDVIAASFTRNVDALPGCPLEDPIAAVWSLHKNAVVDACLVAASLDLILPFDDGGCPSSVGTTTNTSRGNFTSERGSS